MEFEKWSTYHQLEDEPIQFGDWSPGNWNDTYLGWMSMRDALKDSINIPAVKTLNEVGTDRATEFANNLGITFGEDGMVLADALGTQEVTPIQMSGAFAAFGNEGVYNEPYTVRKVESPDEGTVDLTPEPVTAMKDYTAYMITSMLESVVSDGTGTAAKVPGLPMAGKTGTTNKEIDSWFNGYTTNYSISVWTGNQDRSSIENGKNIPKEMFRHLMGELSADVETADFERPDSAVWVDVEEGSRPAKLPSAYTPASRIVTELFPADNQPSNVSTQYQRMDPVTNLTATYNEGADTVDVEWSYSGNAQFTVTANGNRLSSTDRTSIEINNPQAGETYDITVVASGSGGASDSEAQSVSVQIPEDSSEEENEEESESEEETEENESNDNDESGENDDNNESDQNSENDENNENNSNETDENNETDGSNEESEQENSNTGSEQENNGDDSETEENDSGENESSNNTSENSYNNQQNENETNEEESGSTSGEESETTDEDSGNTADDASSDATEESAENE
ncbi:penicillin-binding transpeptidase domain-containing protein [Salimicrobium sp. PL1-032A]|uniref:transglycosylase domain-containing protein n=1 Tax=Salimicrobium sp. PL1-032A TaxID=3095364 RepID=UPI003260BD5F